MRCVTISIMQLPMLIQIHSHQQWERDSLSEIALNIFGCLFVDEFTSDISFYLCRTKWSKSNEKEKKKNVLNAPPFIT